MGQDNPYQSPIADQYGQQPAKPTGSKFVPCPQCRQSSASRIGFTFWGGAFGPWLFTHVKCGHCGTKYNGKTGKSNNTAIAIYLVVSLVVVGMIFLFSALARGN